MSKAKMLDVSGNPLEVEIDASVYKEAHDKGVTVPEYLNQTFKTDASKYGSSFEQICATSGLNLQGDKGYGRRTPLIRDMLEGTLPGMDAAVTRDSNPASRILFPAVVLELIESKLRVDTDMTANALEQMLAIDTVVVGSRFEQPIINTSGPEAGRSQAIGQLALPNTMLKITAADKQGSIPTLAIGMEVSDEAQRAFTIDMVTLALTRQVAFERDSRAEGYISSIVSGDSDLAMAALSAVQSSTFDPASTGGVLTHKAWVKWLRANHKKRKIDWIVCDIDTYLKIEGRQGKPTNQTDDPNSPRFDALLQLVNPRIDGVKAFIVEAGVIPSGQILGIDSRFALRRVRNSEAEYRAIEQFVLRRGTAMRFDFGEIFYRYMDEACELLQITP